MRKKIIFNTIPEVKFISIFRGPLRYVAALSETEILELADYFRLHDGRIHYSQLCQIIHDNGNIQLLVFLNIL